MNYFQFGTLFKGSTENTQNLLIPSCGVFIIPHNQLQKSLESVELKLFKFIYP